MSKGLSHATITSVGRSVTICMHVPPGAYSNLVRNEMCVTSLQSSGEVFAREEILHLLSLHFAYYYSKPKTMTFLTSSSRRIGRFSTTLSSSHHLHHHAGKNTIITPNIRGSFQHYSTNNGTSAASPQYEQDPNEHRRSFGHRYVSPTQHTSMVHQVFQSVSSNYDIMNDIMSFTTHRCWKKYMIQETGYCRVPLGRDMEKGPTFLDVAGGTGDIAELIIGELSSRRITNSGSQQQQQQQQQKPIESTADFVNHQVAPNGKVIVSDINGFMLQQGQERYLRNHRSSSVVKGVPVHWLEANAEDLSAIPDNSIDGYSISFGIRNVTNIPKALKEAYRVLKPGGQFICLEFSKVDTPVLKEMYDWYSFNVIPKMGEVVANDRDSYQYLVESIRKFPDQETFLGMIQDAGFKNCYYENLSFGVVAIHHGFKL